MHERPVPRRKAILIILDGFGLNPSKKYNAVYEANTPRLDEYFGSYAHTAIDASGRAVGLPVGQMGNSEVGHQTLGCGSIMRQDLVRINDAIDAGSFFKNAALLRAIEHAQENNRPVHLLGLVSDGGVHSHTRHLLALIKMARKHKVKPVLHMITDGRDTAPKSALKYLDQIKNKLEKAGGHVATVCGRYFAMDRDNRWDRTHVAWNVLVNAKGEKAEDAQSAIENAYARGETDEFIKPTYIEGGEQIQPEDKLIFFNFRNDRPRQLAEAIGQDDFEGFNRQDYEPITVTCLTEYDPRFLSPIAFPPQQPEITLSKVVSLGGHKQFHCAETEKYAHVTFFFNGGRETPYAGETRVMVPSPPVDTYDQAPEMSAKAIADEVVGAIEAGHYGFMVINFANGDMVGHTAIPEAIVKSIEHMDAQVGRVLDAAVEHDFSVILTADHGNCDEYVDPYTGEPHTQHTSYPVPFLVIDPSFWHLANGGGLADVAPTVLEIMGLQIPKGMEGSSLLLEEVGPIEQKKTRPASAADKAA
ncbi:MAG TPA: 2,3-bisphosphoglycerate-independent phosphoglycerate mutase [Chromatiales bacterium]|nr:2,3-bisphosphoglycerate-independent phosphoglycerate mutase [Thiotrichales bacterium]HIP66961.1 2,3-bisphosphoglycerate-independent phosphoglycerate mutase [Chromatiales bacterium]